MLKTVERKNLYMLIACVLFSLCLFTGTCYADTDTKIIKVGYYEYAGFQELDSHGNQLGYAYDYLRDIAGHTGWQYEYVYADYATCAAMLEKGDIDLMCGVQKTDGKNYLYSQSPCGRGYVSLVVSNDSDVPYNDFKRFDGMTVGEIEGMDVNGLFDKYCRENGFSVTKKTYPSRDTAIKAAVSGQIDAALITNLVQGGSVRSVSNLSPFDYYFAINKSKDWIKGGIDSAVNAIKDKDPYYIEGLYRKHFSRINREIMLTDNEKQTVEKTGALKVVYSKSWSPLEASDSSGQFTGIVRDVFDVIAKNTGLEFEYIQVEDSESAVKAVQEGRGDIVASYNNDYAVASGDGLSLTNSYLSMPVVVVSKYNYTPKENARVAMVGSLVSQANLKSGETPVPCSTEQECIEMVKQGYADKAYVNTYSASNLLQLAKYRNLEKTVLSSGVFTISAAVSSRVDPKIVTILDKGINKISRNHINEIIISKTINESELNIKTLISRMPADILLVIAVLLAAVLLVALLSLRNRNKYINNIERLMFEDNLTRKDNYKKFKLKAPAMMHSNSDYKYAILYLDIEHFKFINDKFGYEEGDKVLMAVSDFLNGVISEREMFSRIYADKFVVLLSYKDKKELDERVNKIISDAKIITENEIKKYRYKLRGGVYLIKDYDENIDVAIDRANYAKASNSNYHENSFEYYSEKATTELEREKDIERTMHAALEEKQFVAYYQGKVNSKTKKIVGAEALVRWINPQRGVVSPGEFLPIFEKNGFIVKIDFYIFEQVCKNLRSWMDQGIDVVPISSNFSRLHILNPYFPDQLCAIADKYRIPRGLLEIELTETVAMENLDLMARCSKRLRSLGFKVDIDDFGSGYSSLGVIQAVAIDVLKLDKDLIQKSMQSELEKDVVSSIVGVAQRHNIEIVCEGVETHEQNAFLQSIDCYIVQGYLYEIPIPEEVFLKKLKKQK